MAPLVLPIVGFAQTCMPLPDTVAVQLSLALAESRIVHCNRDVIVLLRATEAAGADRQIAGQRPNPTLSLGANNINPKEGIGSGSLRDKAFDSSLRIDQLIERGDKGNLREQQANAAIRAAEADYQDALRVQLAQVRTLFFELGFQQVRKKLLQEFASLAQENLIAAEKRFKVGDIAEIDLSRFRLDGARAQHDFRSAEIDLEKARADFARSIGAETRRARLIVDVDLPKQALATRLAESTAGRRADSRPDLIAARERIEAAQAANGLARAISTRDVSVGFQVDRWPVTQFNAQGTGNSYGFSVSIPLFVRHANEGEARKSSVELQSARDLANRVEATAGSEGQVSAAAWIAAAERTARIDHDLLPLAKRVAASAEYAYAKGATSVLELLDARRSLKQAELDAALARADTGKAWAQFVAATASMPNNNSGATQ